MVLADVAVAVVAVAVAVDDCRLEAKVERQLAHCCFPLRKQFLCTVICARS